MSGLILPVRLRIKPLMYRGAAQPSRRLEVGCQKQQQNPIKAFDICWAANKYAQYANRVFTFAVDAVILHSTYCNKTDNYLDFKATAN